MYVPKIIKITQFLLELYLKGKKYRGSFFEAQCKTAVKSSDQGHSEEFFLGIQNVPQFALWHERETTAIRVEGANISTTLERSRQTDENLTGHLSWLGCLDPWRLDWWWTPWPTMPLVSVVMILCGTECTADQLLHKHGKKCINNVHVLIRTTVTK